MHITKSFSNFVIIMSKVRKKASPKPIPKSEPKKREEPKPELNPIIVVEEELEKPKKEKGETVKFIRISIDASREERQVFNERVIKGEIKLSYYSIDGKKGYHYYKIIKG